MTVSNEVNKSGPYPGNGSAVTFNYSFRIVDETHLKVIRAEAGVETVLTLATDYTVSGVGDAGGGSITTVAAPTASQTITLVPDVPFTQELDLENQGGYYAEDVERGFDLAVLRDQQLQEQLDRAVTIPSSYDNSDLENLAIQIDRLGDSSDNIDTVAGSIGSVNEAADNIAAIIAAPTHASIASTKAAEASQSASDAATLYAGMGAYRDAFENFGYLADWGAITEAPGEILDYGDIVA